MGYYTCHLDLYQPRADVAGTTLPLMFSLCNTTSGRVIIKQKALVEKPDQTHVNILVLYAVTDVAEVLWVRTNGTCTQ